MLPRTGLCWGSQAKAGKSSSVECQQSVGRLQALSSCSEGALSLGWLPPASLQLLSTEGAGAAVCPGHVCSDREERHFGWTAFQVGAWQLLCLLHPPA